MNSEFRASNDPQHVAYVLAVSLSRTKTDREAVDVFASTSGPEYGSRRQTKKLAGRYLKGLQTGNSERALTVADEERLMAIRQELSDVAVEELAERKGQLSVRERAGIVFQAKFRSGLNKKERVEMYKKAGYTDDEILGITGKKMSITVAANGALTSIAWAGLGLVTQYDDALPLINEIPSSIGGAIAAVGVYTASFAGITEQNLRLTKTIGASMSPYVTGLYALGNRLLPEKVRDWTARSVPIVFDAFLRSGLYASAVAGVTGDAHKVIAGSLFGAALNTLYSAGCEGVLQWKKRQKSRK